MPKVFIITKMGTRKGFREFLANPVKLFLNDLKVYQQKRNSEIELKYMIAGTDTCGIACVS